MSRSAKKKNPTPQHEEQSRELPQNNHNLFWQSSLFNEVYLQNDVPSKYREKWDFDEAGPFYLFCNQFRNLCEELREDDLNSWSERNTINRFIKPVLRMLGYMDNCSPNQEPWAEDEPFTVRESGELKTYKPDLIIVNDPKELKYIEKKKGDEKLDEASSSVILPIEAKYWARLDEVKSSKIENGKRADKKDEVDSTRAFDFEDQTLKYMDVLKKDYGILTDGKTWRIYSRELSSGSFRRCFQFNLGHLMRHINAGLDKADDYQLFIDNAKYFFHLFCKEAVFRADGGPRFLDELLEYSKKYSTQVEEDLKARFVKAMTVACNAYYKASAAKSNSDYSVVRNVSESQLFNILFIRYCESRGILPVRQSPTYRKISLSNIIDKLEFYDPVKEEDNLNILTLKRVFAKDFDYKADGTELYDRLLKLTNYVQNGTGSEFSEFEIVGFRESIFSKDEWKYVQAHKVSNRDMVRILFELGYTKSDVLGKKFQQIPFNFFSPRQLGSIYESFLEFKIDRADSGLIWQKRQWQEANLDSAKIKDLDVPKVRKGELYFTPDNSDRKATGSYYTPDYVVQYLVALTADQLLEARSSKEILKIRLCDPAMGSGHFLSGCLGYVAKKYLEKLELETNDDLQMSLMEAKQLILHNCIFGVDLNDRAVKLAKMSLWLESAAVGRRLENLDDQLKAGDSISGSFNWKGEFKEVFAAGGFDAIIGNPPWGAAISEDTHAKLARQYPELNTKVKDSFKYFYRASFDLAKDGGYVAWVIPSPSLLQDEYYDLRKIAVDHKPLALIDLGDGIFPGVTAPTSIHLIQNVLAKKAFSFLPGLALRQVEKEKKGGVLKTLTTMPDRVMVLSFDEKPAFLLGEHGEDDSFELLNLAFSSKGTVSLENIVEYFSKGVETGCNDAFLVEKGRFSKYPFVYPILRGSDFERGKIRGVEKSLVVLNGKSEKEIPNEILNHIGNFKSTLKGRSKVKKGSLKWFELNSPKTSDMFAEDVVILRQTGDSLHATQNTKAYRTLDSVHNIKLRSEFRKFSGLLVRVLNSNTINSIYQSITQEKGRALAQVKNVNVFKIPMPNLEEIAKLEKKMNSIDEAIIEFYKDTVRKSRSA